MWVTVAAWAGEWGTTVCAAVVGECGAMVCAGTNGSGVLLRAACGPRPALSLRAAAGVSSPPGVCTRSAVDMTRDPVTSWRAANENDDQVKKYVINIIIIMK